MAAPNPNTVNMPGVTPITAGSFKNATKQMQTASPGQYYYPDELDPQPVGSDNALNPGSYDPEVSQGQPVNLPEQKIGPEPDMQVAAEPQQAFPGNPPPVPEEKPISFNTIPFDYRKGLLDAQELAANAPTLAHIANTYRQVQIARSQGRQQEADIHLKSAQDQEESIKQSKADFDALNQAAEKSDEAIKAEIAKAKSMSIDPDRWWHRKGTANNILAAISLGLGSFGSGMTHGATGNVAMQLISNAIDHDIDAQKADIDNAWKGIQQQKGLNDNAYNRGLVKQNIQANFRLAGLRAVEDKLKSVGEQTDSNVVKLGANDMIDKMQLDINHERKIAGATALAMDMQAKKDQAAAQAANAVRLEKYRKERGDAEDKRYDKNLQSGMSQEDAARDAAKWADAQYPELARTQFASPGQRYQVQQESADKEVKRQQDQAKKLGKQAAIAEIAKGHNGDLAAATEEYNLLMDHPEQYKEKILDQTPGAIRQNPYEAKTTAAPGAGTAIDPVTGQNVSINQRNRTLAAKGPDDKWYILPNESIANKWREDQTISNKAKEDIDVIANIVAKHPNGTISDLDPNEARNFTQAKTRLTAYYGAQANAGTMGAGDVQRFEPIVVDPWKMFTLANHDQQVQDMKNSVDKSSSATFAGYTGLAITPTQQAAASNTSAGTDTSARDKKLTFTPKPTAIHR